MSATDFQIGYFIILLAACVYLCKNLGAVLSKAITHTVHKRIEALHNLQKEGSEVLEDSFELWWTEGPQQRATQAARRKMTSAVDGFPEALNSAVDMLVRPVVDSVRDSAFKVAVSAYIRPKEKELISHLPRFAGVRTVFAETHAKQDENLDEYRAELLDYDIRPDEVEARFSPQQF